MQTLLVAFAAACLVLCLKLVNFDIRAKLTHSDSTTTLPNTIEPTARSPDREEAAIRLHNQPQMHFVGKEATFQTRHVMRRVERGKIAAANTPD